MNMPSLAIGRSKVTTKYQLTIPKNVRDSAGIIQGSDILFRVTGNGRMECRVICPPASPEELAGCLKISSEVKKTVNPSNLTEGLGEYISSRSEE